MNLKKKPNRIETGWAFGDTYYMRNVLLAFLLTLSGCASVSEMHGPDGEKYVHIECDGSAVPMSVCYNKAKEVCPQGYYLVERDKQAGAVAAGGSNQVFGLGQAYHKNITIKCK